MSGVGCMCGWPLDRCDPRFANGTRCGKRQHEAEVDRDRSPENDDLPLTTTEDGS